MLAIQICPRAAASKVLPVSEKVKVFNLITSGKKWLAEVARSIGRTILLSMKL